MLCHLKTFKRTLFCFVCYFGFVIVFFASSSFFCLVSHALSSTIVKLIAALSSISVVLCYIVDLCYLLPVFWFVSVCKV